MFARGIPKKILRKTSIATLVSIANFDSVKGMGVGSTVFDCYLSHLFLTIFHY